MGHITHIKKIAASIGIVTALSLSAIIPALADTSGVSQEITGGTLTMDAPANLVFASGTTAYSHIAHTVTSNAFQIAIDDSTGNADGWTVSMVASDLVTGDGLDGKTIAAANVDFASVGTVTVVAGQAATNITKATAGTALGSSVTLMSAAANEGQGSYTLATTIDVNIPAYQQAGVYTGTLTTTEAAGPVS